MNARATLGLIAVLLAADTATKVLLSKPEVGGWHEKPMSLAGVSVVALGLVFPITRLPGAVCLAGVLGNALWAQHPRGVPNVFVSDTTDGAGLDDLVWPWPGATAYNLADLFITWGGYATAACMILGGILWGLRVTRAQSAS